MTNPIGAPLTELDTPQLTIDLDIVDANLRRLFEACQQRGIAVRTHFKSLKCGGLAQYIARAGCPRFLCAKLNEAEVLADAGLSDLLIANQLIGPHKLRRLVALARRVSVRVCVDDADNVAALAQAAQAGGVTLGVLIELEIGMHRCGVEPGPAAVALAQRIAGTAGLRFDGIQAYDGHLQLLADREEKRKQCWRGLDQVATTRRLLDDAGLAPTLVTGAGTGTWEFSVEHGALNEIQPGSFVLMDCAYHVVRPEFGCALAIHAQVISRHPAWYILDAGSKAISRDFGTPVLREPGNDKVTKLSEEHTTVESTAQPALGARRDVIPAHCCATMNLHRQCVAIRRGIVEAVWPIEASGRYD